MKKDVTALNCAHCWSGLAYKTRSSICFLSLLKIVSPSLLLTCLSPNYSRLFLNGNIVFQFIPHTIMMTCIFSPGLYDCVSQMSTIFLVVGLENTVSWTFFCLSRCFSKSPSQFPTGVSHYKEHGLKYSSPLYE